jgi:hypothetical protein
MHRRFAVSQSGFAVLLRMLVVLLGRLAVSHGSFAVLHSRLAESQREGAVSLTEVQVPHGHSGASHE